MACPNSIAMRLARVISVRSTNTWMNSELITNTRITTVIRTRNTIVLLTGKWESERKLGCFSTECATKASKTYRVKVSIWGRTLANVMHTRVKFEAALLT